MAMLWFFFKSNAEMFLIVFFQQVSMYQLNNNFFSTHSIGLLSGLFAEFQMYSHHTDVEVRCRTESIERTNVWIVRDKNEVKVDGHISSYGSDTFASTLWSIFFPIYITYARIEYTDFMPHFDFVNWLKLIRWKYNLTICIGNDDNDDDNDYNRKRPYLQIAYFRAVQRDFKYYFNTTKNAQHTPELNHLHQPNWII